MSAADALQDRDMTNPYLAADSDYFKKIGNEELEALTYEQQEELIRADPKMVERAIEFYTEHLVNLRIKKERSMFHRRQAE